MKKLIKNKKFNFCIIVLLTMIVLYFSLKDNFFETINQIKNLNFLWLIVALLLLIGYWLFSSLAMELITKKFKKNIKTSRIFRLNVITQFFNGITPFSTGGQPMEIYMLTEHNISLSKATNYTVQSFIFYQIALVICGIFAVTYNFIFKIFPEVNFLKYLVLLGFLINIGVVMVLLLVANSKKLQKKMCNFTIKVSKKLKLKIKEEEITEKFKDLYEGFKELSKRKKLTFVGIGLNILSLIFLYIIPLFVLFSMHDYNSLNVADTLTASAYIYVIGAFVPIPGASGGIEYGFTQFFGNFIGAGTVSAVLLIWRFITYYFGVILGAIIFIFEKKVNK